MDEYLWKISFYELKPKHPDFIWLCAMPGGTVFRDMDEGGKMERRKFEETCQAIENDPRLPVMRTYG